MIKKFLLLVSIFFHNFIISYPVSGGVYNCDYHSVLLFGERHCDYAEFQEIESKELAAPYIKVLVEDSNIDFIVESTELQLSKHINYLEIHKAWLLNNMKTYVADLPLIDHLGFLKHTSNETANYNRFNCYREAQNYFQVKTIAAKFILGDWRSSAIIRDILNATSLGIDYFGGLLKNDFSFPRLGRNFKVTRSVNKFLSDYHLRKPFIKKLIETLVYDINNYKLFDCPKYTIYNLLTELNVINDRLNQLQVSSFNEEKILWNNFKFKIEQVKNYILQSIEDFKSLSIDDQNYFQTFFPWSFKYDYMQLHWFAPIYSSMLKNQNLKECDALGANTWTSILIDDIADAGFMSAIVQSKKNKRNAVIYAGADHCASLSKYLISLGYQRREEFGDLKKIFPLQATQLESLTSKFLK